MERFFKGTGLIYNRVGKYLVHNIQIIQTNVTQKMYVIS
jgi:hypothetical protein